MKIKINPPFEPIYTEHGEIKALLRSRKTNGIDWKPWVPMSIHPESKAGSSLLQNLYPEYVYMLDIIQFKLAGWDD